MTTTHKPYGVEIGTADRVGATEYEVEEFDSKAKAKRRLKELKAAGYVTGAAALKAEKGARYALAVYLDSTGCPQGEL